MKSPRVIIHMRIPISFEAAEDALPTDHELIRRAQALLQFGTPGQVFAEKLGSDSGLRVGGITVERSDSFEGSSDG